MNNKIIFSALAIALSVAIPSMAYAQTLEPACPLSLPFMKAGVQNSSADVAKLQAFLKDSEQADVDVNGIFDEKTDAAVKAFQKKYADAVLAPWDATKASGIVYITTPKKIDQLACGVPLTLSAEELSIISAYKQSLESSTTLMVPLVPVTTQITMPPAEATTVMPIASPEENLSTINAESVQPSPVNAASNSSRTPAADVSLLRRFWRFLKGLF